LECDGTEVATENYIGYITSLASANYTFNTKVNLSEAGIHTVKVSVILEDDMNPNNDSKTKTVENIVTGIANPNVNVNSLVAWTYNDLMYVEGLNIGDRLEVYSVIGNLIYLGVARNEIEYVKLNTRGVYIVKAGSRVVKVVYY
jgi:hypothetical protein